jgi:cytochrome c556
MTRMSCLLAAVAAISLSPLAFADTPQEERHEIMEDNGAAAKEIGRMIEGESAFDAGRAMDSMRTWQSAAAVYGDMFPAGSETGFDTRASETIWSDREGFDAALEAWSDAVDAAIAANPQDLEALKAATGPVFKKCKACHEEYRLEEED